MISTRQIIGAIDSKLKGDASLTAVVPSDQIGNHLKDDVSFPHIIYGLESENLDVKGQTAYRMTLVLDVWSSYRGEAQLWQINDLLNDLLDAKPVTIASGTNSMLHYESTSIDFEGDGRTRHATITYVLIVTE